MMRLRNAATGVVVSCSEETAARLGHSWIPVDGDAIKRPAGKSAAARKRAAAKAAADKAATDKAAADKAAADKAATQPTDGE
ncbi:hypothetical protein NONO_c73440 [Nocardia nova SH22a]|uniref:Uncharacterized protein n=1 Tax=Nocardia nova SH22a TaxID=1415166 RepID=W5TRT8_9NOCA|nr:hypothetical protein [Nocardia nova]AHH22100.1 hypothetical protein NONO_c73440 [Nocardia nova SH22a]